MLGQACLGLPKASGTIYMYMIHISNDPYFISGFFFLPLLEENLLSIRYSIDRDSLRRSHREIFPNTNQRLEEKMLRAFSPRQLPLRNFSVTAILGEAQDISKVPLSVPLPQFFAASSNQKSPIVSPYSADVSVLDNKIRVASQEHFGDYCTIGLAIESGSRFEALHPAGTSHLVEKLAFGANVKQSSREEIYEVLERNGGLIDCQSTRDTFIYAASCHIDGLDEVMEVIANSVWRPQVTDDEFKEAQMIVEFENEDMAHKIECEPLITDWIHMAAFRGNTLGFSKYTKNEALAKITKKDVLTFMSLYHRPERIVVAGVGIPHDQLRDATQRYFNYRTATWNTNPEVLTAKIPSSDNSVAQYTGGEIRIQKDLSKIAVGTPYPHLAHVGLGFEGCSYKDDDFVTMCVIQSLLGGGGSFSAGGPGKGMYTRLYTEVMNSYHWIYSCIAYNHSYADTGLFCIHAACPPEGVNVALQIILAQFMRLLEGAEKDELSRAKIQLKSQLMMNLEIRPVMFEDLARQVIGHGKRRLPMEYMEQIDKVTSDDIARVGQRLLAGKPSLVGYGVIDLLASYGRLEDAAAQRDFRLLEKKDKIFSWQK